MSLSGLPDPRTVREAPWYVRHWTNKDRSAVVNGVLEATAMPRLYGMESGTGFFAVPSTVFPADSIRVSYEVWFPKDFTWVKGGKIGFGVGIGDGMETASGGDWLQTAGSVRTMWREDGQAIGYVYLPLEGKGRDAVIRSQSFAFEKAATGSMGVKTGINVFHKAEAGLAFKKGTWNTVELEVTLNDIGKKNGRLQVTVNGETRRLTDVVYRRREAIRFNGLLFQTFFGGGSREWACARPQTAKFRNLEVERLK